MSNLKKILITGGTGYVGSRVAQALVSMGYSPIVVDIATPEERGITFSKEVEFRQHDLRISEEAVKGLRDADIVLHLASDIGSLTYMHDHQAEILTNNSAIDASVYPALLVNNIPSIVYSSSSMVFQYPPQFPYTEADISQIRPPSNVYGFTKLAGEYFCRSYAAQHGLQYTIVRYHNIFGPGEDSKGGTPGDIHVIPALLEKVLSGQYPLELLGNPNATRPFTYVDDAIEATVDIVVRAAGGDKEVINDDFNIGNDSYYSILELSEIIWKKFGDGRTFSYVVKETKADTAMRREVDISKIKSRIGWSPKTSLEDGLVPTAMWIKDRGIKKRSLWG